MNLKVKNFISYLLVATVAYFVWSLFAACNIMKLMIASGQETIFTMGFGCLCGALCTQEDSRETFWNIMLAIIAGVVLQSVKSKGWYTPEYGAVGDVFKNILWAPIIINTITAGISAVIIPLIPKKG